MNINSGIKRGRKFANVVQGAREIFLRDGFDGSSVDDIARTAGVSKATLYNYFPDKRLLFLEVARTEIETVTEHAMQVIDRTQPPELVLAAAARTIIGFNTSRMGLGIFRLCVAEAERFPELGQAFYQAGQANGRAAMVEYFTEASERGELRIPDLDLASDQFFELCRADLHMRMLLGVTDKAEPAEVDRIVDSAVALFLARYAA